MSKDQHETITRLRALYEGRGEDRIFARIGVRQPPDRLDYIAREVAGISCDVFPSVDQLFPLWEEYLAFYEAIEDDWLPAIYPRQYDQGLYGALFGATMELDRVDGPGWICSMTSPLDGKTYSELLERAARPDETWIERMEADLRMFAAKSGSRFGIAVAITIDGLNLAMQIRGSQALLDLQDCSGDLKAFLQAAVDLNILMVKRQRAAIGMECDGGVHDFFNAGWMPEQGVPMSVDCYNFCHREVYAEFGRSYQQQLIDHFGGGNFHLHGNGRHLLPELAKLRGCIVVGIGDDGSRVRAIDDLASLKSTAESLTLAVRCDKDTFVRRLREKSLPGGVYYRVGGVHHIDDANRLMESVRNYRV